MATLRFSALAFVLSSTAMVLGISRPAFNHLQCRGQSFGLAMVSKINQTGHSITYYSLKKSAQQSKSPWKLDLQTCVEEISESQVFTLQATVTVAPRKPDDYDFFPGIGYYKLYTIPSNFSEAMLKCSKDGGHLAIINSDSEYNVLANMQRQQSKASTIVFVGFHDQIKEGEYITIFGDPLSSTGFVKWKPGDPNGGKENCGGLYKDAYYVDVGCEAKLSFFCEYDLSWNND